MISTKYQISINAPADKVWETLWDKSKYPQWTSVFSPGSNVETDWQKGSKVLFLDGNGSGMLARIHDLQPNRLMSFQHYGVVNDGVEDTTSDKVKEWAGAFENYHLDEKDGSTTLLVEMEVTKEYEDYFEKTWPKALEKVKALAEQ